VLLAGCERRTPRLTVGFVGVMSGRSAGLGIDGRDGFLLALDEANRAGGVDGKDLVPLVLDSGVASAPPAGLVKQFKAAGVAAVIGPMRSQVAAEMVPLADAAQLVMISPTVSSDELQGQDDYFFRTYFSNRQSATGMARLMAVDHRQGRVAVLYNTDNRAYTEDYLASFRSALAGHGAEFVAAVPFSSLQSPDYTRLFEQIRAARPEGVLVLANAVDTAMFCQQVTKGGERLPIFTTPWSFSDDLIAYGGKAVEGVTLLLSIDPASTDPRYDAFRQRFIATYGREPRFSAVHAYDATALLVAALRSATTDGRPLKQALLELGTFPGLQHEIEFDVYGDIGEVTLYPVQISAGRFAVHR